MSITPNADQFKAYAQSDNDGEVVMLNLLKFKRRADDAEPDADEGTTGAEAYRRYGRAVSEMLEARGAKILWMGRADHVFIGDVDANDWDSVALVSYPNRATFLEMVSTPEYDDAHTHRQSGLERTVIIACTPQLDALSR